MPKPRPDGTKKCPMCQETKTVDMFYASEKYDGGYSPYCKPCAALKNKQHRNKARDLGYKRSDYKKNPEKFRALSRLNEARLKAEKPAFYRTKKFFDVPRKDVASDVTKEWLQPLFENTKECQCCGKELSLGYEPRETRRFRSNPDAPSIDRVDNHKGYTRENIAVICWGCNYRKNDLSKDDLVMFLNYIERCGNV